MMTKKKNSKKQVITGPTYLTILRMMLAIVFVIFVQMPETAAKVVALSVFIAAAITDKIDGIWARKHKLVTDMGAFLDPLADKMLVDLALLVLVYLSVIPLWIFAVILVRDLAVDGMRMMLARDGVTVAASFYGKLKTTVQMVALVVILFNMVVQVDFLTVIGNILLYIAVFLTVFSGWDYLSKGYKKIIK